MREAEAVIKWPLLVIGTVLFVCCGIMGALLLFAAEEETPAPFHEVEGQASWLMFGTSAVGLAMIITGALL